MLHKQNSCHLGGSSCLLFFSFFPGLLDKGRFTFGEVVFRKTGPASLSVFLQNASQTYLAYTPTAPELVSISISAPPLPHI